MDGVPRSKRTDEETHRILTDMDSDMNMNLYQKEKTTKTYNSRDSLVVTHPTTNLPACGLSTAERTGSPVFHTLWSYVPMHTKEEIISVN